MTPLIQVTDLTFAYESRPDKTILDHITFSIGPGTITGVIGPSGCGKSTLCQILAGIIPQCREGILAGNVLICGKQVQQQPLKEWSQKVGYVMQDPDRQLTAFTVEDELAFGPENLMLAPKEIRRRVEAVMEALNITDLAQKNPMDLSGGQKQLTVAAAVLTMEPEILILDEPLSHVDRQGRETMLDLIKLLPSQGRTVIVIEHDYERLDFADQWLVMEEGRLKAFAPPAELLKKGTIL